MNPPRHIDTFHSTTLRLSRTISAKHPPISLWTFMKSHLFMMNFLPRVIPSKKIPLLPALQFRINFTEFFYNLSQIPLQTAKNIPLFSSILFTKPI
jgi:hypothetical protein